MMTWILGNIVKQIESGTESWRAESRGGKSLANEHGELYDKKHLKYRCAAGGRAIAAQKSDPN